MGSPRTGKSGSVCPGPSAQTTTHKPVPLYLSTKQYLSSKSLSRSCTSCGDRSTGQGVTRAERNKGVTSPVGIHLKSQQAAPSQKHDAGQGEARRTTARALSVGTQGPSPHSTGSPKNRPEQPLSTSGCDPTPKTKKLRLAGSSGVGVRPWAWPCVTPQGSKQPRTDQHR